MIAVGIFSKMTSVGMLVNQVKHNVKGWLDIKPQEITNAATKAFISEHS